MNWIFLIHKCIEWNSHVENFVNVLANRILFCIWKDACAYLQSHLLNFTVRQNNLSQKLSINLKASLSKNNFREKSIFLSIILREIRQKSCILTIKALIWQGVKRTQCLIEVTSKLAHFHTRISKLDVHSILKNVSPFFYSLPFFDTCSLTNIVEFVNNMQTQLIHELHNNNRQYYNFEVSSFPRFQRYY